MAKVEHKQTVGLERYGVIRHPTYWAVVDKKYVDDPLGGYRRVSRHRSRNAAWKKANKLNKELS